ncbi:hypothetical protein HYH02_011457 [Chlamydomonas schloesseri]|uniref:Uncharacterized protein n=1 Tax=Chlamydomonas schloesseri TaxID=2026947 RepID=A0A835T449_9CHLO|nr:hypothetical protein HYH02_011457 [Chlamydomonas schloesseri]|eukprot:KAG2437026.1 hypothetical protein HYH02_011457 [Chlamydomonas schloesseri]
MRFVRSMQLRELDWREALQRGVAEDSRASRRAARALAEALRQDAWKEYKQTVWERECMIDSQQKGARGR